MFQFNGLDANSWYNWWFGLALPAQIALVALGITIAVLAIIAAVYIIKYLIIALIWIVKRIAKGLAWVFRKIVGVFSGGNRYDVNQVRQSPYMIRTAVSSQVAIPVAPPANSRFCLQCGAQVGAKVQVLLFQGQDAFCSNCGAHITPQAEVSLTQIA